MPNYLVELRGIATQQVFVQADSKAEARRKANQGEFEDATGYPDWEWETLEHGGGRWSRRASTRAVEEIGDDVPEVVM